MSYALALHRNRPLPVPSKSPAAGTKSAGGVKGRSASTVSGQAKPKRPLPKPPAAGKHSTLSQARKVPSKTLPERPARRDLSETTPRDSAGKALRPLPKPPSRSPAKPLPKTPSRPLPEPLGKSLRTEKHLNPKKAAKEEKLLQQMASSPLLKMVRMRHTSSSRKS